MYFSTLVQISNFAPVVDVAADVAHVLISHNKPKRSFSIRWNFLCGATFLA